MDISIILCTYNRCESLRNVLESIGNLKGYPQVAWELIVVDNNSKDRTKGVVEDFIRTGRANVRYVFEGRQGKSFALNSGIGEAKGEILAFTDDDVTLQPQWLSGLKRIFDSYGCSGVGGKIIPVFEAAAPPAWLRLDIPRPFLNVLVAFDYGEEPCVLRNTLFGANMAFKKEVFAKYGQFRTDMGPSKDDPMRKGEDTEFCSRLLAAGETLMYAPDAVVYHPVEKERTEKGYFEKWYFDFGRMLTLRSPPPPERTVYFCGVPRYLYRHFLEKFLQWLFTRDGHRRFCSKLELYQKAGEIVEASRRYGTNG